MQEPKIHILIVDDDIRILELLKKFFLQNGFLVSSTQSVKKAKELLSYFTYDLAILDVMLPEITGLDFAKSIKSSGSTMPILLLTALSNSQDKINGLESGANDYLTKPFEPRELLLRVKNLVNLHSQYKKELRIKRFGNNCYNIDSKEFLKKGELINLSQTEQRLIEILIENNHQIVSRDDLCAKMGNLSPRSIDVQIVRVRSKIEDNPKEPQYLKTIRGQGYALFI